ncbi:K(+)-transporting ATPase subunit C [Arthrobacter flavus]|uniref:Potassium-transporting ATPase KdpC subunit n=1 Tax=Arthrobacter flavus TaxID=95172 RepID=A0ABW4Q2C8_9MICC
MSATRGISGLWVGLRAMLVFTLVLGLGYPLAISGIAQLALPSQANGSLVQDSGQTVGSSLIGQSFTDDDGVALTEWFQSRPSAAGDGYDGGASSGSNLGPESEALVSAVTDRRVAIEDLEGVGNISAEALTTSASGLDPHISPEYALLQVARVAQARGLQVEDVENLTRSHIKERDLGYLGERTVNVLELNLALEAMDT